MNPRRTIYGLKYKKGHIWSFLYNHHFAKLHFIIIDYYKFNEYDFHYVVFQGPKGSFGVPHLVRSTFGIPGDGSYHQAERLAFIPEEFNAPSVYFEKDGWVMRGDGGGNYELAFNLDGIALSLSVSAVRDPVLHYKGTGLLDFGPDAWAYYYSRRWVLPRGWPPRGVDRPKAGRRHSGAGRRWRGWPEGPPWATAWRLNSATRSRSVAG